MLEGGKMNANYTSKKDEANLEHTVLLDGRERLIISGVTDVTAFDDSCVCLDTVCGLLDIEGSALAVQDLSLADGKVSVTGRVGGLWYSEKKQKSEKRGFFAIGKR
jgi:sporulation protein YabP